MFMVEIQIQPKVERGKNDFFHFFRKEREEEQARLVGPEEGKGGALQRGCYCLTIVFLTITSIKVDA